MTHSIILSAGTELLSAITSFQW